MDQKDKRRETHVSSKYCRYWEIGHNYMDCQNCKRINRHFCAENFGVVVPKNPKEEVELIG